jgi:2',3'-cyclic-nucleotide 2'-phosphodiesterase (5'-nucleotidase family)
MPQNYKVLGQIYPTANTLTNVYVTGASTQAVINSLYVCNQDTSLANVSVIVRPINEALANKHFVLRNESVGAASTYILNLGITIGENTIIASNTTYAVPELKTANTSLSAFGIEIT